MNRKIVNALEQTLRFSSLAGVAMLAAFVMSYFAEPFPQEDGLPTSFLGYNRDFLVNGRWWFMAGLLFYAFSAISSARKLFKMR